MDNFAYGVLEPMPRRSVVSFQKKFPASLVKVAPSLNWMAPAMPLAVPPPPPRQVPLTAKQPFLMLMPPVPDSVEVALVKLAKSSMAKMEPGELVPMPTKPFGLIVRAETEDVARAVEVPI